VRASRAFPFVSFVSFVSFSALASLVLACGRSDLLDEFLIEPQPIPALDASPDGDDGPAVADVTVPPPADAQPVEDAAPERDGTPITDVGAPLADAMPTGECNPMTCATGCCFGAICAQGNQTIACGTGGFACIDCTTLGSPEWVCFRGDCLLPQ
jgi:hypothetical protein